MPVKKIPDRWALLLQEFDFTMQYKKGSKHCNADGCSREPVLDLSDVKGLKNLPIAPTDEVIMGAVTTRRKYSTQGPGTSSDDSPPPAQVTTEPVQQIPFSSGGSPNWGESALHSQSPAHHPLDETNPNKR